MENVLLNESLELLILLSKDTTDSYKEEFELATEGKDFDIWKHKNIEGLELAIMRRQSNPHYHTQGTYFCFQEKAILTLGGLDNKGVAQVSDVIAQPGQIYPINGYVIHAVAPRNGYPEVRLFIYTPSGDRARIAEYPDDTFVPVEVVWDNKLYSIDRS